MTHTPQYLENYFLPSGLMPTSSTRTSPRPPSDHVMDIAHMDAVWHRNGHRNGHGNRVHRAYDARQWHAPPSPQKENNLAMMFYSQLFLELWNTRSVRTRNKDAQMS